ncbi:MAG: DMT family transporter [Azospirillaceae bacterium]
MTVETPGAAPPPPRGGSRDDNAPGRGIAAILVAIAIFSTMDTAIKFLGDTFTPVQIFFFRSVFALLPLSLVIRAEGGVASLKTDRFWGHIGRSLLMVAFLLCFFTGLTLLPLTEAYAVLFAAPLAIAALSVPLLGERVGPRRWAAVILGFAGVLVVLRPGGDAFGPGGLVVLAAVVFYAFAMIMVRQLSRTESNGAIVFYFIVTSIVVSVVALPFVWVTPSLTELGLLAGIGILGGIGQLFMTEAYRRAPVAVVSPFQYTQILWGLLYGYLVFADRPDPIVLLGAAVVVASGLYVLHRETRLARAGKASP